MKTLLLCILALGISACASNKLKPVDEKLDIKAKLGDSTEIGVNESGEIITQESVAVEDELRKLSWFNYEAARKLTAERDDLVRCRTDLADPRLNGNKKLEAIPELEISKDLSKVQQKLGITESGRIKVVKKELLNDRYEKEIRYKESLENLLKVVSDKRVDCERELGYVRVQHGLPSERYTAQGYYGPQGNFVQTRPGERNLDDALKIRATEAGKHPASVTPAEQTEDANE